MQYSALTWFQGLIRFFGHTHSYTHVTCTQFLCVSYDGKMEIAVIHFRVSSAVLFHLHQQSASAGRYIRFACNIFTRYITRCAHTHTHTHSRYMHKQRMQNISTICVSCMCAFPYTLENQCLSPFDIVNNTAKKKTPYSWYMSPNEKVLRTKITRVCLHEWPLYIYIVLVCYILIYIYIYVKMVDSYVCVLWTQFWNTATASRKGSTSNHWCAVAFDIHIENIFGDAGLYFG